MNTAYMPAYFTGGATMSAAASLVYSVARWNGVCALGGRASAAALAFWLRTSRRPAPAPGPA